MARLNRENLICFALLTEFPFISTEKALYAQNFSEPLQKWFDGDLRVEVRAVNLAPMIGKGCEL